MVKWFIFSFLLLGVSFSSISGKEVSDSDDVTVETICGDDDMCPLVEPDTCPAPNATLNTQRNDFQSSADSMLPKIIQLLAQMNNFQQPQTNYHQPGCIYANEEVRDTHAMILKVSHILDQVSGLLSSCAPPDYHHPMCSHHQQFYPNPSPQSEGQIPVFQRPGPGPMNYDFDKTLDDIASMIMEHLVQDAAKSAESDLEQGEEKGDEEDLEEEGLVSAIVEEEVELDMLKSKKNQTPEDGETPTVTKSHKKSKRPVVEESSNDVPTSKEMTLFDVLSPVSRR